MDQFFEAQKIYKQNIIEGKTYITDEEAASLGSNVANKAIHIKLRLVSLIESGTNLIVRISENKKQLDISNYSDEIYRCLRIGILMYQDFKPIHSQATQINQTSIFNLALKNMLSGL